MVFATIFRLIGVACLAMGSLAIRMRDAVIPFLLPDFVSRPSFRIHRNPRSIIETRRMGLA